MNTTKPGWIQIGQTPNLFTVHFQELLRIVRIFWETYRFNSREFFTFTCFHRLSTRNRILPPLVLHRPFSTVECSLGYKPYLLFSFRVLFWVCCEATIPKRAVAWVGSVQLECTVPLSTWSFPNFKPEFLLNGKRESAQGFALSLLLKLRFFGTRKWPIVRNFNGSTSEPAMRSCDTGQRIPFLTAFPWCGRQTDRRTDKWLPKFKFLGWIKNQILLAMRPSSRCLAHPWSSAKTYLNLKRRKWRSTRSGGSRTRKILKYSSLKKFQVSRKRRQL